MLGRAIGWALFIAIWPVVKAATWWDDRLIRKYRDVEEEVRRD